MPDQVILAKARRYCAYQERSHQELRDKLYAWGLHKKEVEQVIARMITEGFINEERFAVTFAGGKFRLKSWGKNKIRAALRQKKVSEHGIQKALDEIDEKQYLAQLKKVLRSRSAGKALNHPLHEKFRLARHAIAKGYEPDLVWALLSGSEDA